MAAKSANIYVRIEPEIKEQAENILSVLGIPASNAINMFYKQIILHRGLPFDVKIPDSKLVDIANLTAAELDEELEKGYCDMTEGKTKPAEKVFADIYKEYDI
ncbi:MAG: type II toxin-antitoxin system RelB/DinJ family antitoxin [Clostridia bacterium]|nr:type II toxin-antitoxin system RelB/DinJ family antitoxin [Clostridia bacterium]